MVLSKVDIHTKKTETRSLFLTLYKNQCKIGQLKAVEKEGAGGKGVRESNGRG
jgi:hypothetical protein